MVELHEYFRLFDRESHSMSSLLKSDDLPFAAEGGLGRVPHHEKDPYGALDDLMAAVEALCPVWPKRDKRPPGGKMLL